MTTRSLFPTRRRGAGAHDANVARGATGGVDARDRTDGAGLRHARAVCAQIDIWNAAYGPADADGYPRRVFDLRTGAIDTEVALYMRDHGYDLRYYLEQNWSRIGTKLVGKLHILVGDYDDFFLSPAVYLLQDFLESTNAPAYGGNSATVGL